MKRQKNAYQRAVDAFRVESRKQCTLLFGAASIALYRHWGMKKLAIVRIIRVAKEAWNECAEDTTVSMIQMCEEETGIELQNGSGKSWRELLYLNDDFRNHQLTYEQAVVMRQNQTKWIPAQITASILIAMHRKHGFGYDRCARLYQQMQDIEAEFKYKPDRIKNACIAETGLNVFEEVRAE